MTSGPYREPVEITRRPCYIVHFLDPTTYSTDQIHPDLRVCQRSNAQIKPTETYSWDEGLKQRCVMNIVSRSCQTPVKISCF